MTSSWKALLNSKTSTSFCRKLLTFVWHGWYAMFLFLKEKRNQHLGFNPGRREFLRVFCVCCLRGKENQWSSIEVHPGKLTWNLKISQLKRNIIFQTSILGFHDNFSGGVGIFFLCLATPNSQPQGPKLSHSTKNLAKLLLMVQKSG